MPTRMTVAAALAVLAWAAAGEARVLRGALEIADEGRNTFRVVGHAGTWQAPPGVALEALAGQLVDVRLTDGGRVEQIAPFQVGYAPVVVVVRGRLAVVDAAANAFTFADDSEVYRAPAALDATAYEGEWVEARIDSGRVIGLTRLAAPAAVGGRVASDAASCRVDGMTFPSGTEACADGAAVRCDNGSWTDLDTDCR